MEELKKYETVGWGTFVYSREKHLVKPIVPDGGKSNILGGKNMYHENGALRVFPGFAKLGTQQYGASGTRRITGLFHYVASSGTEYLIVCSGTKVFSCTLAGSASDITGALTLDGDDTYFWRGTYWVDTAAGYAPMICITNGKNKPAYWAGSGNAAHITNAPDRAKDIFGFASHLFTTNVYETAWYGTRDKHTDVGEYNDWSGGIAGTTDLRESNNPCVGSLAFGRYRFIFKEDYISLCRPTGNDPPFQYDENVAPIGTKAHRTIGKATRHEYGFFMGSDLNFYLLSRDGATTAVGDDIQYYLKSVANQANIGYSFAVYYPKIDSIIVFFPTSANAYCTTGLIFDLGWYVKTGEKIWSPPLDLSAGTVNFTAACVDKSGELYLGSNDGYIWLFDSTKTEFNSVDIPWEVETCDYRMGGDFGELFRMQEYNPQFRATTGESVSASVSTDGGSTFSSAVSGSMAGSGASDEGLDLTLFIESLGKKHRVKLTGNESAHLIGQRIFGTLEGRD